MESYPTQNSAKTIVSFITLTVVAIGIFFALQSANTYIRYIGMNDCAQLAQFEQALPEENATVRYPLTEVYNQCLTDKGLTKSVQK